MPILASFKSEWDAKFWVSLATPQKQKLWVKVRVDALLSREENFDLREDVEAIDWQGGGKL
jgi:hypothetical protein